MAQALSCQVLSLEAWDWSQASPCEICSEQTHGDWFSSEYFGFSLPLLVHQFTLLMFRFSAIRIILS